MKPRSRRTFVKNVAAGLAGGALVSSSRLASIDAASQDRAAGECNVEPDPVTGQGVCEQP